MKTVGLFRRKQIVNALDLSRCLKQINRDCTLRARFSLSYHLIYVPYPGGKRKELFSLMLAQRSQLSSNKSTMIIIRFTTFCNNFYNLLFSRCVIFSYSCFSYDKNERFFCIIFQQSMNFKSRSRFPKDVRLAYDNQYWTENSTTGSIL